MLVWYGSRPGDADRGFPVKALIIVDSLDNDTLLPLQHDILAALRASPRVVSATLSDRTPGNMVIHTVQVTAPSTGGAARLLAKQVVGQSYFETYRIALLAGRVFDPAMPLDDRAGETDGDRIPAINAVISASAVVALGYRSPEGAIGHVFYVQHRLSRTTVTIIGVVGDVYFGALSQVILPQFYIFDSHGFRGAQASVRYQGQDDAVAMAALQATWQRVVPGVPFTASTALKRLATFK